MKIVLAQVSAMPLQEEALHAYFRHLDKGSIVVFGEYVFDLFFASLEDTPKEIIAQLYEQKLEILQKLSQKYALKIITPIVAVQKNKIYKQIAIVDSKESRFYTQQFLMDYPHWDEKAFFDNPVARDSTSIETPYVFEENGIKIGAMFGFEAHFDSLWLKFKEKNIDMVLVPSAGAFESAPRWRALLGSRALCNGCMVVRVNRTGKVNTKHGEFEFYGESFVAGPNGEIIEKMGKKDGFICVDMDANSIRKEAKEWGFRYYDSQKKIGKIMPKKTGAKEGKKERVTEARKPKTTKKPITKEMK